MGADLLNQEESKQLSSNHAWDRLSGRMTAVLRETTNNQVSTPEKT